MCKRVQCQDELTSIDALLSGLDSNLTLLSDSAGDLDSFVNNRALANDTGDQATTLSIVSGKVASGENHLHSSGFADGFGQALRTTGTGNDTEVDLGLTKVGGGRGEDDIAPTRHKIRRKVMSKEARRRRKTWVKGRLTS